MRGVITQLPHYVFMVWCLVTHRYNFTFTLRDAKVLAHPLFYMIPCKFAHFFFHRCIQDFRSHSQKMMATLPPWSQIHSCNGPKQRMSQGGKSARRVRLSKSFPPPHLLISAPILQTLPKTQRRSDLFDTPVIYSNKVGAQTSTWRMFFVRVIATNGTQPGEIRKPIASFLEMHTPFTHTLDGKRNFNTCN
jgi:hypothetical protein